MFDPRQNDEPVYYAADQLQKTSENQLRDVEKRHGELRQLEGDIVQLHDIHRDFAELVGGHVQMIDDIESSVVKTESQVATGNKTLMKAIELQSAVRRKKLLCGFILVILIVIAIIIILVIVLNKKSK